MTCASSVNDDVVCGLCGAGPDEACQKTDRWGECLVNVNLSKIDSAPPWPPRKVPLMSLTRIAHPWSFYLAIIVGMVTASLTVVWSFTHVMGLVLDMALIAGLREVSLREGRHSTFSSPSKR